MSLALLVFYVWQINDLTQGSYLINSYEKQISSFQMKIKIYRFLLRKIVFWGKLLIKIQALNFQKVTSVKYIQIPDSSVATIRQNI